MVITYENLEKLRYIKRTGNWRDIKTGDTYYYFDCCENCGEGFVGTKNSVYCSRECMFSSDSFKKKMSEAQKGKVVSEETRKKISKIHKGKKVSRESIEKMRNSKRGRRLSEEHKRKIGESLKGKVMSEESRKKISNSQGGSNGNNWRGGVKKLNIPLFDTYASQIDWCEEVRRDLKNQDILQVRCTYCGKWYRPIITEVRNRIQCINGNPNYSGEHRLYCSDSCKNTCPIYHQRLYPKGYKKEPDRSSEVQAELRQLVLERDDYECQRCGKAEGLHCHHFDGIHHEPLLSADVDECITFCVECHNKAHEDLGCRYIDMQCKN